MLHWLAGQLWAPYILDAISIGLTYPSSSYSWPRNVFRFCQADYNQCIMAKPHWNTLFIFCFTMYILYTNIIFGTSSSTMKVVVWRILYFFLCETRENTMKSKKHVELLFKSIVFTTDTVSETSQLAGCVPPGWYSIWVTWLEMISHQTHFSTKRRDIK